MTAPIRRERIRYRREQHLSVIRLMPGQQLELRIASHAVTGLWTHFLDEARTYGCTGATSACCWDHSKTSLRWQGWLQVCRPGNPTTYHLPITWAAARDCPRLFKPGAPTLRGHVLYASRGAASIRSREYLILGFHDPVAKLPSPENLRDWFFDLLGPQITWPLPTNPNWQPRTITPADVLWDDDPFRVDDTAPTTPAAGGKKE
jgi:hypothetical protein